MAKRSVEQHSFIWIIGLELFAAAGLWSYKYTKSLNSSIMGLYSIVYNFIQYYFDCWFLINDHITPNDYNIWVKLSGFIFLQQA